MDAIIAITVLVIAVIGFVVFTTSTAPERRTRTLIEENAVLANAIGAETLGSELALLQETIDEQRVQQLANTPYEELKQELGLTTDFCIHFEDENGNLIDVGGVYFIGAPNVEVTVGGLTWKCDGTLVTQTQCNDGLDNDNDGDIDLADSDCKLAVDDSESP